MLLLGFKKNHPNLVVCHSKNLWASHSKKNFRNLKYIPCINNNNNSSSSSSISLAILKKQRLNIFTCWNYMPKISNHSWVSNKNGEMYIIWYRNGGMHIIDYDWCEGLYILLNQQQIEILSTVNIQSFVVTHFKCKSDYINLYLWTTRK